MTSWKLRLWGSEWASQRKQWERLQVERRKALWMSEECKSIWKTAGSSLKGNLMVKTGVTYEISLGKSGLGRVCIWKGPEFAYMCVCIYMCVCVCVYVCVCIYINSRSLSPAPNCSGEPWKGSEQGETWSNLPKMSELKIPGARISLKPIWLQSPGPRANKHYFPWHLTVTKIVAEGTCITRQPQSSWWF